MNEYLQKLIDTGVITFDQARYITQVFNSNPTYKVEFTVCNYGGVIMEVWRGNLRQRGAIFGLRRDGTFVEDSLCPDWGG